MEPVNNKIEVVYKKVKISKRLLAYFIDIGLFLMTTFILFSIINIPVTRSKWYQGNSDHLTQLRNESGLYEKGIVIYTYLDNKKDMTDQEKKDLISSRIDTFYQNTTYISNLEKMATQYNNRKLKATSKGVHLFIVDPEDESKIIENPVVVYKKLYNFYKTEVSDYAVGYLLKNTEYFNCVKFMFLTAAIEFVLLLLVTYTLYYLIFPLCIFRRGRQTLGMKLEKIGLITVHADNITAGKFVLRFFFNLGVFVILDFVAFLIPAIVSMTMMFINKANQNLVNYVFNDYAVDITNQQIYLNAAEREESAFKLQEISIENKDLRLK